MRKRIGVKTLLDMLSYKRPHNSLTERLFIARFIDSVPGMKADKFGNRYLRIGDTGTMISCHTDTVHSIDGMQRLRVAGETVRLQEQDKKSKERDCLGSDDGAGVYAALRMIQANIPALYVFHRGEECGGLGSTFIADHTPELLEPIVRCIALDRRGTQDIISHQMMGRCCSDAFAWAFADLLGMGHEPCEYGTFTDSANYTWNVPECTNVAVGYSFEHTQREWLDYGYLEQLIDKLCTIDLESLPVVREPGDNGDFDDDYDDDQSEKDKEIDRLLAGGDKPPCLHAYCEGASECLFRDMRRFTR